MANNSSTDTEKKLTFAVLSAPSPKQGQSLAVLDAISKDYLSNIGKALAVPYQVKYFSDAQRLSEALHKQEVDAAITTTMENNQAQGLAFSNPLFEITPAIWFRDAKFAQARFSELTIACVEEALFCEMVSEHNPNKVYYYPHFSDAILAVKKGNAQALISSFISISSYLDEQDIINGKLIIPSDIKPLQVRLVTNADNYPLLSRFNEILHWETEGLNIRSIASRNNYLSAEQKIQDYLEQENAQESITYSTSSDAYPFFYETVTGDYDGFLKDLFHLIEARTGLHFSYQKPKHANSDFAAFKADLVPIAYSDKPEAGRWKLSDPFMRINYISLQSKEPSNPPVTGQAGILMSVNKQGIVYLGSWHKSAITRYDNIRTLIADLQAGKIATAYIPEEVVHSLIARSELKNIILGKQPSLSISVAFGIAQNNPQLLSMMNAILKTIDEKEIKKIAQQHQKYNIHYGYSLDFLLKLGFSMAGLFISVLIFTFMRHKNLQLKVELAESLANSEEHEKQWLREIISHLNSLVFIHNQQQELVLSNCPHIVSKACTECRIQDKHSDTFLVDPDALQKHKNLGQSTTQIHHIQNCQLGIQHVTREVKNLQSSVSNKPFTMTILHDISEQQQREEQLRQAQKKALAASESRERFLAAMSHELRTPISAVHALLDLIKLQSAKQDNEQLIQQAQQAISHLNLLVDEILDFSKLESGQFQIKAQTNNLITTLSEPIYHFAQKAKDKGLNYLVDIEPFSDHFVEIDALRITQILNNLLSNAIKFTPAGLIKVVVKADAGKLMITISDSGIGMDEQQLAKVFQPFTQADDTITRQYGGTGLGLNIVAQLIEKMGGHYQVTSTSAIGTVFRVELPYQKSKQALTELVNSAYFPEANEQTKAWCEKLGVKLLSSTERTQEQRLSLNQEAQQYPHLILNILKQTPLKEPASDKNLPVLSGRVLVAEDNLLNQNILAMQLKALGLSYDIVGDGESALAFLNKHSDINLVITDYHMPKMDGLALAKEIREHDHYQDIPIIGCTAEDHRTASAKAKQADLSALLLKPYDLNRLQELLSRYLNVCAISNKITAPSWLANFPTTEQHYIAEIFIESMQESLHKLEAAECIQESKKALHNIKGAAATIELNALKNLIIKAEQCQPEQLTGYISQVSDCINNELQQLYKWKNNNNE